MSWYTISNLVSYFKISIFGMISEWLIEELIKKNENWWLKIMLIIILHCPRLSIYINAYKRFVLMIPIRFHSIPQCWVLLNELCMNNELIPVNFCFLGRSPRKESFDDLFSSILIDSYTLPTHLLRQLQRCRQDDSTYIYTLNISY